MNNCSPTDVCVMSLCDMNAPWARGKDVSKTLCQEISLLNDMNPELHVNFLRLPDAPKNSSARGLYAEEKLISDKLHDFKQWSDGRWVELYSTPSQKSTTKRFGFGKVVCNLEHKDKNPFLQASELCIAGRAVGDEAADNPVVPSAVLPKGSDILQSVSASADDDLFLAERVRPSPEQLAFQRGIARDTIFITSALKGMEFAGPVLLVNLTGGVEDVGVAVALICFTLPSLLLSGDCFGPVEGTKLPKT